MSFTFVSEVRIEAPPEAFFAALRDLSAWGQWMQGFVGAELLTQGEFGPGTQWRETRKMFGKRASEVFEVTDWHPPRAFALYVDGSKGSTGKGAYRFRYELEPREGGTVVRMHGEIDIPGWFAKVLGKLLLGTFKKACDRDLYALKAHLEHNG